MHFSSETELHGLIGETMLVTSAFDAAISECVTVCLDPHWIDLVFPMVRKLDQQAWIFILGKISEQIYDADDPDNLAFRAWLNRIGKIRRRRRYRVRRLAGWSPDTVDRDVMQHEITLMREACNAAAIWRMRLVDQVVAMRLGAERF